MDVFEEGVKRGLGPWPGGTVFLAAVSGGADSTAMLYALARLREQCGFSLRCLHVEHGIRSGPESRGDGEAVKALCRRLETPCRVVHIAPGKIAGAGMGGGPGPEGAARFYRRRIWKAEARRVGAERILVAHTLEDKLENILMALIRGAGPGGLAPMPPARGRVLRPLLGLTKKQALDYLEREGIPYRTDSTNGDTRYLRNRVRLKLVPVLDALFPQWRRGLLSLAETQGLAADFLRREVRAGFPWKGREGGLALPWAVFAEAHPIIREEALFLGADLLAAAGARRGSRRPPKGRQVPRRAAVRGFAGGKGTAADLGPCRVWREGETLRIAPPASPADRDFALLIKEPGSYILDMEAFSSGLFRGEGLVIRCEECPPDPSPAGEEDAFFACPPLVFRGFRKGDLVPEAGQKGPGSDKLKKEPWEETGRICAEDSRGIAAVVEIFRNDRNRIILKVHRKEALASRSGSIFKVVVKSGGLDVQ
jgi:tRNA(Ile)-lysidine synthase